jgi:arabinose-5-phosphate isomerase
MAATLASTGTPAMFVHPAEASHGDLGTSPRAGPGDFQLGESDERPPSCRSSSGGISLVAMTGRTDSTLGRHAEVVLDTSVEKGPVP